jgi:hypothetical protein
MDGEREDGWSLERISRRKALKRVAAGTAIAWSAPVLTSLRTPAFAQYGPCTEACSQCEFGQNCGSGCACVGVPDCFCSDLGFCTDTPVCATDADCEAVLGPGARCAPCTFSPDCAQTSCWRACGSPSAELSGDGIHVLRPSG